MHSTDEDYNTQLLDNSSLKISELEEKEIEIANLCKKYKYQYSRYNRVITLCTPFSEWYFNISGPRYKLYHKNTYIKGSGKWSEDYHNQKQQKNFKKFKSIFIYISTHDRNKYCKESKEIEHIKHLLLTIKHSKNTLDS